MSRENPHKISIKPVHEGRLIHGSGPCRVIMRGGKILPEPEFLPCSNAEGISRREVQKLKKAHQNAVLREA